MKNNGKMTAAFMVLGLLALVVCGGIMALIWYAGDFYNYFDVYRYYMIALIGIAILAFLLSCGFAAIISSSNRRSYQMLIAKLKEKEEEIVAKEAEAAEAIKEAEAAKALKAEEAAEAVKVQMSETVDAYFANIAGSVNPGEPAVDTETLQAIGRISVYASDLRSLADQMADKAGFEKKESEPKDNAAARNVAGTALNVSELIDEIDDIAFRAHLLSLNIEIEKSNARDSHTDFESIAEEIRNIENKSAAVASNAGEAFKTARMDTGESDDNSTLFAAKLREISSIAQDIEKAVGELSQAKIAGNEAGNPDALAGLVNDGSIQPSADHESVPSVISPIDPNLGGGLYLT